MGIAFLLPLLSGGLKFFTSKAGLIVLAVVAAFFASIWAVHHFEGIGRAEEVAKEKAETAKVQARLDTAIAVADKQAAADAQRIEDKGKTNAEILATIGRAAPGNSGRGCLDAGGVLRHNQLRQPKAVKQPSGG
jgi:hypothetical protein